jgi:hypothetical protein
VVLGAARGGAREDGGGSYVRAGGEEEEGPAFIGQGTFSPGSGYRPRLKGL